MRKACVQNLHNQTNRNGMLFSKHIVPVAYIFF